MAREKWIIDLSLLGDFFVDRRVFKKIYFVRSNELFGSGFKRRHFYGFR